MEDVDDRARRWLPPRLDRVNGLFLVLCCSEVSACSPAIFDSTVVYHLWQTENPVYLHRPDLARIAGGGDHEFALWDGGCCVARSRRSNKNHFETGPPSCDCCLPWNRGKDVAKLRPCRASIHLLNIQAGGPRPLWNRRDCGKLLGQIPTRDRPSQEHPQLGPRFEYTAESGDQDVRILLSNEVDREENDRHSEDTVLLSEEVNQEKSTKII